jgi:hypothetical protein
MPNTSETKPKPPASIRIAQEILTWTSDKPLWQRDAVRRLLINCEIEASDIDELLAVCRSEHSLAADDEKPVTAIPLSKDHLPTNVAWLGRVNLLKVGELENVNAIASGQELTFGSSGLTVIYGDNGSGKSGYGRVLKRACRARHRGDSIRPNIFKVHPGVESSAEITFEVNGAELPAAAWVDDGETVISELAQISFFDCACAPIHVEKENGIAFTPFGLDIFESLGGLCRHLKKRLDDERLSLARIVPGFMRHQHANNITEPHSQMITNPAAPTAPAGRIIHASFAERDKRSNPADPISGATGELLGWTGDDPVPAWERWRASTLALQL